MEFIFDLFVLPEGPRLRDKLSHGEVDQLDNPQIENRLRASCQLVFASIHDLVFLYSISTTMLLQMVYLYLY
jgi:hypothetical protein